LLRRFAPRNDGCFLVRFLVVEFGGEMAISYLKNSKSRWGYHYFPTVIASPEPYVVQGEAISIKISLYHWNKKF